MAEYADREAFIPYRRADVIELCIEDGKLQGENVQKFRDFCEILSAYYHFDFHKSLEKLKNDFAHIDPDADTKARVKPSPEQCKQREHELTNELEQLLKKANYSPLTNEEWEKALAEESLITLNMDINFDDFDKWVLFHRGEKQHTVQVKKFPFKTEDFTLDVYERVVLLLKFKDEEYFKAQKRDVSKLNYTPGKMYIYLYKNIPVADLEVLFPNVEISMNWKDKLMLIIPAGVAAIPMLFKILPQLLVIGSIIYSLAFLGQKALGNEDAMPAIIAALSALAVLGGFMFKQYIKYKNKRIEFLKNVTDTLFFRNLVCNTGVFHSIVDAGEEEACKEIILAYYHILTHQEKLTQEQLDDLIETWLEKKFDTPIDFDVEKALQNLQNLQGKIVADGQDEDSAEMVPILTKDENGFCTVLDIDDAKTVIDYAWDNFFQYN